MYKKGFTLIELLVVIAIIGVLASVVLASLNSARGKANDAKVKSDFRAIQQALQLYYDDNNTMPVWTNSNCCSGNHTQKFQNMAQDLVDAGYLPSIPQPPSSDYIYQYYYYGGNIGGLLITTLNHTDPSTGYPGTCRPWASGVSNWCTASNNNYYCLCNQ